MSAVLGIADIPVGFAKATKMADLESNVSASVHGEYM
jgi:hypothetical protein